MLKILRGRTRRGRPYYGAIRRRPAASSLRDQEWPARQGPRACITCDLKYGNVFNQRYASEAGIHFKLPRDGKVAGFLKAERAVSINNQ